MRHYRHRWAEDVEDVEDVEEEEEEEEQRFHGHTEVGRTKTERFP